MGEESDNQEVFDNSYQNIKLLQATRRNNVDQIQELLSRGADVNSTNKYGWSPLMVAADEGHLHACVLLSSSGADVDLANDEGDTAVGKAAMKGHYEVVQHLIKQNTNIHKRSKSGKCPLMRAAAYGHFQTCVLLIASGADIDLADVDGNTALVEAANRGYYEVAQHLINKGANCNVERLEQCQKDDLLRYGSSVGDLTMCANLVSSGAVTLNQNVADEKLPLFLSAANGHNDLCQWMIQIGADDAKCLDPLLYCYAKSGEYELCKNALDRGADPRYSGCLQIAIDLYHTDIAQLLIEHTQAKVDWVKKLEFWSFFTLLVIYRASQKNAL